MKVLLVDGNNQAHRCFTDRGLCARYRDAQVLAIVFLRIMLATARDFRANRVLCAWDGTRSAIRMALHPNYKGSRAKKHADPSSKHDVIKLRSQWMADMMAKLGIIDVSSEHGEADDMLYRAHAYSMERGWETTIVSNDSDLRAMVNETTEVHLGRGQPTLTLQTFKEKWGFEPWMLPIYKAMVGDTSDDIPGVRGVGATTAKTVMLMVDREKPGTMVEALAALRSVATSNRRAKKLLTQEGWDAFKLALRLIDLSAEPCPPTTVFDTLEQSVMTPFTDQNAARQMLTEDGLAEIAFDVPMYTRELVRLPHGT